MLIVSIVSACIMQHVAGFFLAPAKKQQDKVAAPSSEKDMETPLAEFRSMVGDHMAEYSCGQWLFTFGEDSRAGCKQHVVLQDPECDAGCRKALHMYPTFISSRCPETCASGALAASKLKSVKSKSAWAAAFEKKFVLESKEEKDRKENEQKRKQKVEDYKDRLIAKNKLLEWYSDSAEARDSKVAVRMKDIEAQELEDEKSEAERKEDEELKDEEDKESKDEENKELKDEEDNKDAKAVKVHADKDDATEEKKQEHPEKVNLKEDEPKKEADSKALGDKSEKKAVKAGSDEDVQAQIRAEAMKAFTSKTWQKKVADMEAKGDDAKPDKSWGTSLKPESGLLASIFVYAFLFA